MRAFIQRVQQAHVIVEDKITGNIGNGLLIFVGIEDADMLPSADIEWLSNKIAHLRIFNDEQGLMNKNVKEINGGLLVVSQFTLFASTKKGNRPSYSRASKPETAQPIYEKFIALLQKELGKPIATGVFRADMKVHLINDGPVTIFIDTKNKE